MQIWEKVPSSGLEVDPRSGKGIQNTPAGDSDWIIARLAADGVITVASGEIIVSTQAGRLPPDDAIYIKGCPSILLMVGVTPGGGGSVLVYPKFAMTRKGTYYQNVVSDLGGGGGVNVRALSAPASQALNGVFSNAASAILAIVQLPNPGANWMKIAAQAVTADTATGCDVSVSRGFCPVPVI